MIIQTEQENQIFGEFVEFVNDMGKRPHIVERIFEHLFHLQQILLSLQQTLSLCFLLYKL